MNVEEAIAYLRNHEFKQWQHFHLSKCGQCGAPSWQQPCPTCSFYPMGWADNRRVREHPKFTLKGWENSSFTNLPGMLILGCKETVAYQQNTASWEQFRPLKEETLSYRSKVAAFEEEAKHLVWPTMRDMWEYVYLCKG